MVDKAMACPFDLAHTVCHEGMPRSWENLNKDDVHCRAWVEPSYGCNRASVCPTADCGPCMTEQCLEMQKVVCKPGYCRLIPHD